MAKAKTVAGNYKSRITKTDSQQATELVDLSVEQAANTLQQGVLSIKSQMIAAQGDVKKAEINVADAERNLESSKGANPFNVQNILNARTAVKQAQLDLETKQEVLVEFQDTLKFLEELETELFS